MDTNCRSFASSLELHNPYPNLNRNLSFFFLIFSRINGVFEVPIRILLDFEIILNFFFISGTNLQSRVERFPSQIASTCFVPPS